ncbi:hypothetical protein DFH27DRAFT_638062 [Peziza echinospora]|nr:hypothetical protein DFH27DRAFT_638062 [Peziza echinospora]
MNTRLDIEENIHWCQFMALVENSPALHQYRSVPDGKGRKEDFVFPIASFLGQQVHENASSTLPPRELLFAGYQNLPPVPGLPPPLVITFESQFKSDAVMGAFFIHRNNKGPLSFSAKIDASLLQRGKRAEVRRYVDRIRKDTGADVRQRYRDLENIGIYTFDKAT